MFYQRQFSQRVIITFQTYRFCITDMMNDIYTITNLVQAKAFTGKNVLVTLRVQLREPVTELELFALDSDGAIRYFSPSTAFSGRLSAFMLKK